MISITTETVTINHYRSLDAGSFIKSGQLTFQQLVHYLSNYYISDKNKYAAGLFVASEMSDPYRVNKNILNKTCITIDFDDIPEGFDLPKFFKDNFKNSYIIYSTWQHTEVKQRLRIVIPLTKPLPNEYYAASIEMYENVIGFPCDQRSKVLSQAMALPTVQHENSHRIFEVQDTTFTDTDKLIELIKRQQPKDKPLTLTTSSKRSSDHWDIVYGRMADGDGRDNAATSLLGLLLRRYVPLKVAVGLLQHWNNSNIDQLTETELKRIIKSVVKIETERRGSGVT